MDQATIKTVAFGGFDKQDVVRYIEQSSKEALEIQTTLQRKNDALQAEISSLQSEVSALQKETAILRAQLAQKERDASSANVRAEREKAEAVAQAESDRSDYLARIEQEKEEALRLVETYRPGSEAYTQLQSTLGAIECEAHKRASDLEAQTARQLEQTTDVYQEQFQNLMASFESAAAFATAELRKLEVALAQLPRTMDASSAELNKLRALLQESQNKDQE